MGRGRPRPPFPFQYVMQYLDYVIRRMSGCWLDAYPFFMMAGGRVRPEGPTPQANGEGGSMTTTTKRFLFWAPRVLTIVFILFLGLFALDVFQEGYGFWGTLVALFMHLIPNLVLLVILLIAWHREWVGAIAFAGLGLFYLVMTWGRFHWSAYLAISGPLFLAGVLFLMGWMLRDRIRA